MTTFGWTPSQIDDQDRDEVNHLLRVDEIAAGIRAQLRSMKR